MGLRVIAALAAASLTPTIFAFAAQHAPAHAVGRFIALVSLGVTRSIALGVPLGTWLGGHLGWRATFAAMAVAGVVALVAVIATLPGTRHPTEMPSPGAQLGTLRAPAISLGLLANCALMTGSMMVLTYLASYLGDTADAGVEERALTFSLAGVAGMLGIWWGGLTTDRWGPNTSLAVGVGAFIATMIGLWACWLARPAPLLPVVVLATVWGGMAFWNAPPIQARLHALAGPLAPQALALNTSGTYIGVAAGAAVGGVVLDRAGAGVLPLVAAGFGLMALLLLALAGRES